MASDEYTFKVQVGDKPNTRRGILSTTSSLYDPLGFVAPVTLLPKILLQRISGGWDDEVAPSYVAQWNEWKDSLHCLKDFRIPRCYEQDSAGVHTQELHVFSDASESAYGAVVYLRQITSKGPQVSFILGKSRVAPKKTVTIPRLELNAAAVACKLAALVTKQIPLKPSDTTFWTDSMAVLRFIYNKHSRFKVFVANRLSIIHEFSQPKQWRYVNTKENPADVASRGALP